MEFSALVIPLVGLIENLVKDKHTMSKEKRELNENYFEQNINPIWVQFSIIHEDYKVSFKRYTDLASENNFQIDELLEKMQRDSIYTRDLRIELAKLIKYLPSDQSRAKEDYLSDFAEAIAKYFELSKGQFIISHPNMNKAKEAFFIPEDVTVKLKDTPIKSDGSFLMGHPPRNCGNIFRIDAVHLISKNQGDTKEILDKIIVEIQQRYINVADTYYRLKNYYYHN